MLTIKQLKEMKPGIFATGLETDNSDGINMMDTGKLLRWVATRGGIHDWAIYCHTSDKSEEYVRDMGDKVHSEEHIKKLVSCDEEAFKMYRH